MLNKIVLYLTVARPSPSNLIVLNSATWGRGEWDMFDVGSDFAEVDHYLVRYGKEGKDQTEVEVTGMVIKYWHFMYMHWFFFFFALYCALEFNDKDPQFMAERRFF